MEDPLDNVKVFATQSLAFNKHSKTFYMKNIFSLVQTCLMEKSWRVKYALLENFENLLLSTQSNARKPLLDFFESCLRHPEEEVLILSFKVLRQVSSLLEPEFIMVKVLPILEEIQKNGNEYVRIEAAASLSYLAPSIGKNSANKSLKDLLLLFLKDPSPQLRVEIFSHLEPLDSVIPVGSLLSQLQEVLTALLSDPNWKIRDQTVKNFKMLFEKLDEKSRENPQLL